MNERVHVTPPFDQQILRNKLDTLVKKYRAKKQKQSQIGAAPSPYCLTATDESLEDVLDSGLGSSAAANQSCTEFLFGDEMEDMIPPLGTKEPVHAGATLDSSTPVPNSHAEGGSESPKVVSAPTGAENESSAKNSSTPRSKACSQPDIQGKPNKKRKSNTPDDIDKTMKELVQVFKENAEEKKKQEQEKIQLMRELLDLRRSEMEMQRQERAEDRAFQRQTTTP
ncbi:hypothetical protein R1sor_005634 [Riccia sorocarpa]|uniref:Uncharacterized protein n=1 Tax=Riccia sorocarpa TaxID=122646 RepID=A0ABD3HK32_9MARC